MAITVKHSKVSTIPDGTDTSVVRPSDWNDDHVLTGTIPVANGGTGASTASDGLNNLLPSQTSNTGKVLTTDGTNASWVTNGSGTVTSVAATAGIGISVTGSPITTSGTLNITNTAPDQTVVLTAGTGISTTGTYPNFTITNTSPSAGGDVVGPASATDNAVARFDTTTGKLIQNSVTLIDDTGNASGILSQQFSNGSAVTLAAGKIWYDGSTGAWNAGMGGGNITQQIGEELFVYGKASAAITDSPLQIVYHTGTVGASGVITFAPTIAGITDENAIIGVATESLALNAFGRVTSFGVVRGITTNGTAFGETWADDDVIWYNPVTGNPTNVKPSAPNIKFQIGLVIKAGSGGSGSFQVALVQGTALGGTDSNVKLNGVTNGQIISYDGGNGYWKNTDLTAGTGISISETVNGVLTVTNTSPSSGGTVTSVTGTSPVVSSGGNTPAISMPAATTSVSGYLTSTDWTTFNNKGSGTVTSVAATVPSFLSVTGSPITTSGTLALTYSGTALPILNGGTGQTTANAAFNALAPSQTSNSGKYLTSNGTDTSWASLGNAYSRTSFTATAAQTTFTVAYTVGLVQVYVNGVLLNGADYTATNGTSVVLAVACNAGEIVEVLAFTSFSVASTVSSFSAGTTGLTPSTGTTGNVTLGGTLAVANGGTGVTTKTGTGNVVLSTSPSLTTPAIAGATSGSITLAVPAVAGTNTITFPASTGTVFLGYPVNYLMAAGGGGGGGSIAAGGGAAGGGAGGLISNILIASSGTVYTITVGAGGAGGIGSASPTAATNSSITGLIEAVAGGAGGYNNTTTTSIAGASGGSGGGGAYRSVGGSGTSGQGNAGGNGLNSATNYPGGGGGGSGTAGVTAPSGTVGGAGGAGTSNSITGSAVIYAAGGGGGTYLGGTAGAGGSSGVGGAGGVANATGSAGTVNTGSGGGGSGCTALLAGTGGAGGSGVVILSIPTAYYSGTTTGSPTVTTSGSNTILKYTSSGTYTA